MRGQADTAGIEITPAMIEAGAEVIRLAAVSADFFWMAEELVADVLLAVFESLDRAQR